MPRHVFAWRNSIVLWCFTNKVVSSWTSKESNKCVLFTTFLFGFRWLDGSRVLFVASHTRPRYRTISRTVNRDYNANVHVPNKRTKESEEYDENKYNKRTRRTPLKAYTTSTVPLTLWPSKQPSQNGPPPSKSPQHSSDQIPPTEIRPILTI